MPKIVAAGILASSLVLASGTVGNAGGFYENAGYTGGGYETDNDLPSFGYWWQPKFISHNDMTSSILSQGQHWMVYEDAGYGGYAMDVNGRDFSNLWGNYEGRWWGAGDWNDKISSARRI
ncbi:MAG: beta/gamma crystallin-related protein [Rothia sp. (in: high G+C Gram-positive bacteria)]|uniref:beta/gamma crystallin-related protein n=1 Tax=Rothia sp. (in: high G+C Gram-positive bacteria) TaxID=1885016 RepID=UPI0026DF8A18|nr:beta/gamma crystallin-related protein [Rothia sp. (in: high G+C Gram-positive bacteria)]MDO5750806.1 beta/gamma crystallin-related protein [Rothia sp. (in: high G+C Gram-positive bacteria)]